MSMSIKAVWNDDIRRFKVDLDASDAFDQLLTCLLRLFKHPAGTQFLVRYLDDENELITVTSTEELAEAQRVAQQTGRNLKFWLEKVEVGSDSSAAVAPSASSSSSAADIKIAPAEDSVPAGSAPRDADDGVLLSKATVAAMASVAADAAPGPAAPAAAAPSAPTIPADEIVQLFMSLLQQEWAAAEIEAACAQAQQGIIQRLPVESIVSSILSERKQLAASELAQRLQPLWPAIFAAARSLDFSQFKIAKIVSFIPQLLRACERPCLAQIVGNVARGNFANFEEVEDDTVFLYVQPGGGFCSGEEPAAAAAAAAPPAAASAASSSPAVHRNIICDMCEASPIVGVRYKCQRCPDFDMCETCEAKNLHPADHILLKISEPIQHGSFGAWRSSAARRCGGGGARGHPRHPHHHHNHHHQHPHHHHHQHHRVPPRAEFVSDSTVADHSQVAPGSVLTKVWMVKNPSADCAWPEGVRVSFLHGTVPPSDAEAAGVPVKAAAPGEVVPVAVEVRCPDAVGRAVGNYRLQLPSGVYFGHRLWVSVDVQPPQAQEPVAAQPAAEPVQASVQVQQPVEDVKEQAQVPDESVVVVDAQEPQANTEPAAADPASAAAAAPAVAEVAAPAEPAPAAAAVEPAVAEPAPVHDAKAQQAAEERRLLQQFRNCKYVNEMMMLHQLGFTNSELNQYILLNKNGNLQSTVDWLLAHST